MQDREEDQENHHGVPLALSHFQAPPRCLSPVTSVTITKRPLQLVNHLVTPVASSQYQTTATTTLQQPQQQQQRTDLTLYRFSANNSPQGSSDFERCSFDYEPNSSTEFDRHSSEEELSVINLPNRELHPEKRKWSQANGRCSSCYESSGSSDEEVRDLLYSSTKRNGSIGKPQPLVFSASPPRGVHKLTSRHHYHHSVSPRLFLANVSRHHHNHHHTVSPRKRHRQSLSRDVTEATAVMMQRPCLDFEKMQVSAPFFICIEPVMTMTSGVLG